MRREPGGDDGHGIVARGLVNFLEIQLNSNLQASSLEDMEKSRQLVCLDFAKNLNLERKQFLSGCPTVSYSNPAPVILQKEIEEQNDLLLKAITSKDPNYFNGKGP